MKKFAFMMIASMAMSMIVSLTSCHNENKTSEACDSLSGDNVAAQGVDSAAVQVKDSAVAQSTDSIPAAEAQNEDVPAENRSTEKAE